MLKVEEIHSYYGQSHVLHGVSLGLNAGEIVCILGRNGVGKTTTLKSIIGLVPPRSGSITFKGQELIGLRPFQISRLGIGFVPEERRIFGSLTVEENLLIGMKKGCHNGGNSWSLERVYETFPVLKKRRNNLGKHLSGGEQQILTIVRTLMGNPEVLLVDEPTEGLAPLMAKEILGILSRIREDGVSILMVEQNFKATIKMGDRFYVMNKGQIVFEGTREDLMKAEDIRMTYLEV